MTSIYEKTQGTKVYVSAGVTSQPNPTSAVWLSAACATKEISFTGGQKADIDVTTLCSEEQETTNGLPAPSEMTISRNWSPDEEAQYSLYEAYETDTMRSIKVIFPSGNGYAYLAEVRQNSWSAGTSGVVSASFTLRIKGKPVRIAATDVSVTGVTLNKLTAAIAVGDAGVLIPTFLPANATNKTGTFISSAPAIVSADPVTGQYEGLDEGAAIVTFTAADGDFTAACNFTVTEAA
ncbi:phage tail tube protein [Yersinia rohdei]|uniref:phage tail tube protein n=1 Tax=Yersinia rohdei TaxID=29485 RepID=UPI0011A656F7|nr:phage tail tube protein [Yersinia rohdei]